MAASTMKDNGKTDLDMAEVLDTWWRESMKASGRMDSGMGMEKYKYTLPTIRSIRSGCTENSSSNPRS